jgi:hypothetical protein
LQASAAFLAALLAAQRCLQEHVETPWLSLLLCSDWSLMLHQILLLSLF